MMNAMFGIDYIALSGLKVILCLRSGLMPTFKRLSPFRADLTNNPERA